MRDEICTLITKVRNGNLITDNNQVIFCEKKSCTRSEFYAAYAIGLKPQCILSISPDDYEQQSYVNEEGRRIYPSQVIYNGVRYNILRTYCPYPGEMEVTIQ